MSNNEIIDLRKNIGVSVRVLCSLIGANIASYYRYEKGLQVSFRNHNILKRFLKLCKLFEMLRKDPDKIFEIVPDD